MARYLVDPRTPGDLSLNPNRAQASVESAAVPRVEHPYPLAEFKRDFYFPRKPLVIRVGDFERLEWRTRRWQPDYLIERVGCVPVVVQLRQAGGFGAAAGAADHTQMPFDAFVRRVMQPETGHDDLYLNLQGSDFQLTPPVLQLLGDFTLPIYFHDTTIRWINLWMGHTSGATKSQLHHDYHDNLYCVVQGRKEFVIFPPREAPFLYTKGNILGIEPNGRIHYSKGEAGKRPHFSLIDTRDVDPARFPKYAFAHPRRVVVEAGDVFFLPTGWFHEVYSQGRHIALNFWAEPPVSKDVRGEEGGGRWEEGGGRRKT